MRTLLVVFSWLAFSGVVVAEEARTFKEGAYLVTEGTIKADSWFNKGLKSVLELANYNRWILQGIDGKDPVSAKNWDIFTSFEIESPEIMVVVYDINLGWPLGSKNNRLRFVIEDGEFSSRHVALRLIDRSLVIEDAWLSLTGEPSADQADSGLLRFRMGIHLAGVVEALFDRPAYDRHINWLVNQVIGNLKRYCGDPAPK